jgi:predicted nuclease with TOPRIM domain
LKVIEYNEVAVWVAERTDEILSDYRSEILRHTEKIQQALLKIEESTGLLLEEVVIDGELTVPGAASKLAEALRSQGGDLDFPTEPSFTSVQELLEKLESYLKGSHQAGRRYIPRLPKAHKRAIKELDYQIRVIGNAYQKIQKVSEKTKLPKELDILAQEVDELEQKTQQLLKITTQLVELRERQAEKVDKLETRQQAVERFHSDSGLSEIETIRREIDSIRMLVTNKLNFLKKPLKKLGQAAGSSVMLSSTAVEGADAYSSDPWQAFGQDREGLSKLKACLTALSEAVKTGKLKFKQSIDRRIVEREKEICGQGGLDELVQRYSDLIKRQQELESSISTEEQRDLQKALDRAKWERRDVDAEIAHGEEQTARLIKILVTLKQKVEKMIGQLVKEEVDITFPDEVQSILEPP